MINRFDHNLTKLRELTVKLTNHKNDYINNFFTLASDIIVILENEILIEVNPAWTEILGWTYEETIGKNWRDFILPEDVESSIEQIKQNLSSERSKTKGITNRYITKNGKIVQLWWSRLARDEKNHIYTIARLIENFNP